MLWSKQSNVNVLDKFNMFSLHCNSLNSRSNEKYVTVEDIQKKVSEQYNIKISDMSSSRRLRSVARPRQIAMYIIRKELETSLPSIGEMFGGRDHTTVMHSVEKIDKEVIASESLRLDLEALKKKIYG